MAGLATMRTVRNRQVHNALANLLEDIFGIHFIDESCFSWGKPQGLVTLAHVLSQMNNSICWKNGVAI